ncbi:nuclear transport factor 2 family protein [Microtetraspora niveoalba]|uniref:nuclear transport factor 2 family protein n=1 Tax=Microtetraspora niveoalba TaxID=46175 RepID=UPI00082B5BC4|nr:nuclear transport factor 2 family protein [Microtetraspora niveoalba]
MATPLEIVEAHYAASARGDLDGMLASFAPDVEWTEMAGFPLAGTYVGPDAIRAGVFGALKADWPDFAAEPYELVAADGKVIAFGEYSGTYAPTGRAMRVKFVHYWQVRDERVVRFEQFTDTHLVRAAMAE